MTIELIKTTSLLFTLTLIYGAIIHSWPREKSYTRIATGALFGMIAVFAMMMPVHFTPGVIFDPRSVILSLSGVFGGPLAAAVSAAIAAPYRLWVGGAGAMAGMLVVLVCAASGAAFHTLRRRYHFPLKHWHFLVFGLLTHALAILCMIVLPPDLRWEVASGLFIPFFVIYPPVTLFLAVLIRELEKIHEVRINLRNSEQRFRALVETTYDWVWELDTEANFTYVSPRVYDLLGYRPEELIGKSGYNLMPPEEAEIISRKFSSFVEECKPFTGLLNINLHKNGHRVLLESSAQPFFDEGGKLLGYRGIDRDITERNELESKYFQAQKMEAIGQLTGGVAHDFNNLLSVICSNLELLEFSVRDEEEKKSVRDALAAVERGAHLTEQLLAFSRKQPLQPTRTDLTSLIEKLSQLLNRTLGEAIAIRTHHVPDLWPVQIDEHQMENAILNMALNARDAMPGGGEITLQTRNTVVTDEDSSSRPHVPPGEYVLLSVTDYGHGMDGATLARAFEPFFTTKEVGKGSGLGLSMVYGFVKQSGGYVHLVSEIGKGTTVMIHLPRDRSAAPEVEKTVPPAAEKGYFPSHRRVLLVEDEIPVRSAAARLLDTMGFEVLEACDGPQAMKLLSASPGVDLLFTDVILPHGMSGTDIARQAREVVPGIKVLFCTGHSQERINSLELNRDHTAMISKPYRRHELINTLQKLL